MFHVKHVVGPFVAVVSLSCGYHTVHGASSGSGLAVAAAPSMAPGQELSVAAVTAAREALASEGALSSGSYPRLVIQLVRVDEGPLGIAAVRAPGEPDGLQPIARGSSVGVVGRGWVETAPGVHEWDSGDVRRTAPFSATSELADAAAYREAARTAAKELGRALARRALGQPQPRTEASP